MEKQMVFWWEKEKEEEFRMFIIHSFSEYLLSIYYVPTIVLGVWNISKTQMDRDPCHHGAHQRSCTASPQKQPPQSVLPSCQFCYPCSPLWPSCPHGSALVLGGWDYRKQSYSKGWWARWGKWYMSHTFPKLDWAFGQINLTFWQRGWRNECQKYGLAQGLSHLMADPRRRTQDKHQWVWYMPVYAGKHCGQLAISATESGMGSKISS